MTMNSHRVLRRTSPWAVAIALFWYLFAPVLVRHGWSAEVTCGEKTFRIPDHMELQVAAGPDLVARPIHVTNDDRGYLYVTESSGSNDPVQVQLAERPHRVLRLEDTDGDGRYDRRTVFADRLMFPEGVLWHDGSLYIAAPPSIWKLTDTDGDGVADEREEWFAGQTLTGCANDLHGPYLGRDGWIYWCKGAFAEQTYSLPKQGAWTTRAAHIFRRHPTEDWIEPVMTGGMDNPVDVVFTPGGDRIFTTTFLQHPGGGRRDGLIHAVYGGVWGKQHSVLDGHPRTGDLMPVLTHLGAAAPSGLTLLETETLGRDYQGNLVAALFNLHKVSRHQLHAQGAGWTTIDTDLVATDDLDFHPTDVHEDGDGSLLVVDTGGWYKLCCPTSQLWKPDVLGTIYRLRPATPADNSAANNTAEPTVLPDPFGNELDWDAVNSATIVRRLADPRPAVRRRAAAWCRTRGDAAVDVLDAFYEEAPPATRTEVIWCWTQIGTPVALDRLVQRAAADTDLTVRQAALQAVALHRYASGRVFAETQLAVDAAQLRRVAAMALGRIGDTDSVPALLQAARLECDRHMFHALAYALWEIGAPAAVEPYLQADHPTVQRLALAALQMHSPRRLAADMVLTQTASAHQPLRDTAFWVLGQHPEWHTDVGRYVAGRLAAEQVDKQTRASLEGLVRAFAKTPSLHELLGSVVAAPKSSSADVLFALRAMATVPPEQLPQRWHAAIADCLQHHQEPAVREAAVAVARRIPPEQLQHVLPAERLLEIAQAAHVPRTTHLALLGILPPGTRLDDTHLSWTLQQLELTAPAEVRGLAIRVLQRVTLDASQQHTMVALANQIGPLELEAYLLAVQRQVLSLAGDRKQAAAAHDARATLGRSLVSRLAANPALVALSPAALEQALAPFDNDVRQAALQALADRLPGDDAQRQRLAELASRIDQGDIRRGQRVFHSSQAACITCHALGYLGGEIGPDLSRIGQSRSATDLLEAILYPSASFVRSYEPWTVATDDGRVVNGVLRDDDGQHVQLVTTQREAVRIPRSVIETMQPATTSIMPAGLDEQLTEQQLLDLVAFLLSRK